MKETFVRAGKLPPIKLLLGDLWSYRGLVWAFCLRDVKAKYTQTVLGIGWVLLSPLITVGVFTFVFGYMVKIPSDGLPYLIFYLAAIIPWYAFVATLNQTIASIEGNAALISKTYFPRLLLGCSYALSAAIDFCIGFLLILTSSAYYGVLHAGMFLIAPLLLLIQTLFALGIGFFLAPLNARYRDVRHAVPLAVQLYYFATPILYPMSIAPEWAKAILRANPMATVIDGFRLALLGRSPDWGAILLAGLISLFMFLLGALFFLRQEQDLVDTL